jgi:DNA-binding phage protein
VLRVAIVHQRHHRVRKLGTALGISPKSLMRMFGPSGNPTAENLLAVIGLLQQETGVRLHVRAAADAA